MSDRPACTDTDPRAGENNAPAGSAVLPRRKLVFGIIALALLMMSLDSTIVATALHSLQLGLGTSINWAGWTLSAYSFGFVLMLPLSGRLCERFGHRKVFIGSVIGFTAVSLLCALADDIAMLIALRALQAAAGAGFTPSATGIVVEHFGDARDRAVSLFGSIFPIGAMIGPIFGGLFVTYWSWRGVFFVNVPIGIAVAALAWRHLPHERVRARPLRFAMDGAGMLLLGAGLLAAMLAASALGEQGTGVGSAAFLLPAMAAVVALPLFFRHIERAASPLIAPRLLHGPGFGAVNLVNLGYGGFTTGATALIPLYATHRYGFDALGAGALLVPQGLAAIALSVACALALRRTGHRAPLYAGGSAIALGMLLLALEPAFGIPPFGWLAGAALLIGAGRGTINPASRNAGLQLAPEQSSSIAALRTAALQVGSISAVSIVTAVLARVDDPSRAQAWIYAVLALGLIAALPLVRRVPEHRGAW